jgi:hypothetical protein
MLDLVFRRPPADRASRYLNMDYAVLDALRDSELDEITFTYDIWCKYNIHLEERAKLFPPEMASNFLRIEREGFIPKLHMYNHGTICRSVYNLLYHRGMAWTDGESIERDWAVIVTVATQTGEMNGGTRHGALNDHWIDNNFKRLCRLSKSCISSSLSASDQNLSEDILLRWLEKAIKWARIQRNALEDMERGIPQDQLMRWKKMVADWEADHSKPNPYEEREEGEHVFCLLILSSPFYSPRSILRVWDDV